MSKELIGIAEYTVSGVPGRGKGCRLGGGGVVQVYCGIEMRNERLYDKLKNFLLTRIENDQSRPVIYLEFNLVQTSLREIIFERTHMQHDWNEHSEEITSKERGRKIIRLLLRCTLQSSEDEQPERLLRDTWHAHTEYTSTLMHPHTRREAVQRNRC